MHNTPAAGTDPLRVFIDGQPQHQLPVTERGLHYGDGLFETLLLHNGQLCQWTRHLHRLSVGAARLGIPLPDVAQLTAELFEFTQNINSGVVKLILTRGSGGRGYRPPQQPTPHRILLLYPLPPAPAAAWSDGIVARHCHTPASSNPALAGLKHLNRLDAVLARREWDDPAISEGVMCDPQGAVVGGTMSNLFVWTDERLLTPPVTHSGIAGTCRAVTLEFAAQFGITCAEAPLTLTALTSASGLFFTNAIIGVWPVRELAGRQYDRSALPVALLTAVRLAAQSPT
ncbi:aminodeoxychorismate lyase [Chromatium okenii]|uniref:aminodeoxychorismate lyase n=1 Tax=Chromatium okenii TaxID=61644 RepID=UPI001908F7D2|nr:aminodeoxychorismate lyase [Chromatium okenii]MBK1642296.1 aminodeoxychorismate lyase [Chromatium okenii]